MCVTVCVSIHAILCVCVCVCLCVFIHEMLCVCIHIAKCLLMPPIPPLSGLCVQVIWRSPRAGLRQV